MERTLFWNWRNPLPDVTSNPSVVVRRTVPKYLSEECALKGTRARVTTAQAERNLENRRAAAVREYLTSRGMQADRLRIVSYGEERPKHDNTREETRRLNRRAALVVRLQ
jgi:outer membrane protein OmpA-like peptidoglycan-associated protein